MTALTPASLPALFQTLDRRVAEARGRRDTLLAQRTQAQAELEQAQEQQSLLLGVRVLYHVVSEQARETGRRHIEDLVRQALQAVFGPRVDYSVTIAPRAGRTEADLELITQGAAGQTVQDDSREAHGGGYTDVETFGLRIALLEGSWPRIDGPLVLDEVGKHVSAEYQPILAQLIRALAARFGRQVIMVTHEPALAEAADRAWQFRLEDGISRAEVVAG